MSWHDVGTGTGEMWLSVMSSSTGSHGFGGNATFKPMRVGSGSTDLDWIAVIVVQGLTDPRFDVLDPVRGTRQRCITTISVIAMLARTPFSYKSTSKPPL